MPHLITNASNLDFNSWLRGLFSAGISGGASAIVGGFTVSGMDPKDFNFSVAKFYILIGALFTTNAIVSMAKFLSTQPLPNIKEVTATRQITTPATLDTPKVVETITEKHIEALSQDPPKEITSGQ